MATLHENTLYVEESLSKLLLNGLERMGNMAEVRYLVHTLKIGEVTYAVSTDGMRCHLVRVDKVEGQDGSFAYLKASTTYIRVVEMASFAIFRAKVLEVIGGAIQDERNTQYHLRWWDDIRLKSSAKAILGLNGQGDEVILRGIEMHNPPEDCWMVDYKFISPLRGQVSNVLRARAPQEHRPLVFGTEGALAVVMPMYHPNYTRH